MKNRGFTLVELLGVIVILMVITILVFPAVTKLVSQSKDTVYQKQVSTILLAAYDYTLSNNYFPSSGETDYLTLGELKTEGLIDIDITDPHTNEKFPNNLVIGISYVQNSYNYNKHTSMLKGNYLYELIFNDSIDEELLPTIELTGLTPNADKNYILSLDLNQEFQGVEYSATSSENEDLTDKVRYYVTSSDVPVNAIDTANMGIYKVYYFVVDKLGRSNSVILNAIVSDISSPQIVLPENSLPKRGNDIDLMEDVSCIDNSGYCNISITNDTGYGPDGRRIVEYTATDPTGNTTTVERIITTE